MKYIFVLFAFCLILILAGCSKTGQDVSPVSSNEISILNKDGLPFSARIASSAEVTIINPNPYHAYAEMTGTGNATHMGKIQFTSSHHNNQATIWDGQFETIAANGDELYGTYTGVFTGVIPPATVQVQFQLILTGGTGKFDGASGTLIGSGEMDNITKDSWLEFSGLIFKN
jgi:hypothetical protein